MFDNIIMITYTDKPFSYERYIFHV